MKKNKNTLGIVITALSLITATFGSILTTYKISALILGIVTCICLIGLLKKEYGLKGTIIALFISIFLMSLMAIEVFKFYPEKSADNSIEYKKRGTLEVSVEKLVLRYCGDNGNNQITELVNVDGDICQDIRIDSIDYDISIDKYKIEDGKIIFSNIPAGTYDIIIQLDDFSLYSGTVTLKEKELSKGNWNRTICVQSEADYKEFKIFVSNNDEILKESRCNLNILDGDYIIDDMTTDQEGALPYVFYAPYDLQFAITLSYEGEKYTEEYSVNEISNPLQIEFDIPLDEENETTEKDGYITIDEFHEPNDAATVVSRPSWNIENDLGIDGKKYGGGLKITISNMFISMGSGATKDVTSRMVATLHGCDRSPESDDNKFEGIIVLDKSMYGSDSTGVIKILVNNNEVFSTGKIGGETLEAIPFSVNLEDADSFEIITEAHLVASDFVYGLVSPK